MSCGSPSILRHPGAEVTQYSYASLWKTLAQMSLRTPGGLCRDNPGLKSIFELFNFMLFILKSPNDAGTEINTYNEYKNSIKWVGHDHFPNPPHRLNEMRT